MTRRHVAARGSGLTTNRRFNIGITRRVEVVTERRDEIVFIMEEEENHFAYVCSLFGPVDGSSNMANKWTDSIHIDNYLIVFNTLYLSLIRLFHYHLLSYHQDITLFLPLLFIFVLFLLRLGLSCFLICTDLIGHRLCCIFLHTFLFINL